VRPNVRDAFSNRIVALYALFEQQVVVALMIITSANATRYLPDRHLYASAFEAIPALPTREVAEVVSI